MCLVAVEVFVLSCFKINVALVTVKVKKSCGFNCESFQVNISGWGFHGVVHCLGGGQRS